MGHYSSLMLLFILFIYLVTSLYQKINRLVVTDNSKKKQIRGKKAN